MKILAPVLLPCLLVTACGGEPEKPARKRTPVTAAFAHQQAPTELAELVPPSAAGVVYFKNLDALLGAVRDIAKAVQPGAEKFVGLERFFALAGFGVRPTDLDMSKPVAFAASADSQTFIVAAKDVQELVDVVDADFAVAGDYIALGMTGTTPQRGASSKLLADLPAGDVALRLDLGLLEPEIQQMHAQMLEAAKMQPSGDVTMSLLNPLFEHIQGGGYLDGALSMNAGTAQFSLGLDIGHEVASTNLDVAMDLMKRVRNEPGSISCSVAASFDEFMDMFDFPTLMSTFPESQRRVFLEQIEAQTMLYENLGDSMAMTMRFAENGLRFALASRPTDIDKAKAATIAYANSARELYGISDDVNVSQVEIDGVTFDCAEFDMTMLGLIPPGRPPEETEKMSEVFKALYGDPSRAAIARIDDDLHYVFGVPESEFSSLVQTARAGNAVHESVGRAREAIAGATPWVMMAGDIAGFVRAMGKLDFMIPEGRPNPFPMVRDDAKAFAWMAFSQAGTVQRFDIGGDVLDLVSAFQ